MMKRNSVIITGSIGLAGAIMLTALCLFIMARGWIPALLTNPTYVWGLFLFLAAFSVAEIPMMIFGMRRIAAGTNSKAKYLALLTNTGYTFFAAVYATPFILLTGYLWAGATMAALSVARFISAIIFLPDEK
jgi:hypothetical protein